MGNTSTTAIYKEDVPRLLRLIAKKSLRDGRRYSQAEYIKYLINKEEGV